MHDDRRHFRPYTAEEADRLLASDPEDWSDLFDPLQVRPGLQSAMRPRGAARLGVPAPVAASLSLQVFGVGLIGFLLAGRASGGTAAALLLALSAGVAAIAVKVLARREWARLVVANAAAMFAMAGSSWLLLGITRPSAAGDVLLVLLCVYVASAVLLYLPQASRWFRGGSA
jgi:hypothetical protein